MDYAWHYQKLIDRARNRALVGYAERHHVTPRCMGGGDEPANIVRLTAEEHFVAHQLLVRIYPEYPQLIWAAHLMASRPGNKLYGWVRRRMADARRGTKQSPEHIAKLSAVRKGKPRSAAAKAKTSATLKGHKRSPETRARMSASAKARGVSELFRQRGAEASRLNGVLRRGKKRDPSVGLKISATKQALRAARMRG